MLPKADSSSFVLFSLLFVLTLTDPPRTGKSTLSCVCIFVLVFLSFAHISLKLGENGDYYSCDASSSRSGEEAYQEQPGAPVVF